MKTLDEKYQELKENYLKYYIVEKDSSKSGNYIPLEKICKLDGQLIGFSGDGTVNLSLYLTWAYLNNDFDRISNGRITLNRLIDKAYNLYNNYGIKLKKEPGFFLRDDIYENENDFHLSKILSGYKGSILCIDEDVCYSPFISLDQCWNLLPVLKYCGFIEEGKNIFGFVVNNHHTIYNPYLSTIVHNYTYCDLKIPYINRLLDREKHLKYNIKVKRGANNWYFSYGFKKSFNLFGGNSNTFLSGLWYKPFIFLADRIWDPICCLLNKTIKNNSYYTMGLISNAWYFGDMETRFIKKFNKSLSKKLLFLPNLIPFVKHPELIDKKSLLNWLNKYPDLNNNPYKNPIEFMILYSMYKNILNNL